MTTPRPPRWKAWINSGVFKSIGMPLTFADIDAKEEDIPLLTQKARCDSEGLLGGFVRLTKEDIEQIYRMCL